GDRAHPHHRGADGGPDDRRLRDRRVDDAFLAELADEAVRDLERSAVDADILADQEDARVAQHLLAQPFADRVDVGRLALRRRRPFGSAQVGGAAQDVLRTITGSASTTPFAYTPRNAASGEGRGAFSAASTSRSISSETARSIASRSLACATPVSAST